MIMQHELRKFAMAALVAASGMMAACASHAEAPASPGPIAIHGNTSTFEIAPVLLAADRYYPGEATVKMGGIPNLVGEAQIQGFGSEGVADVATHAETQALRYSVKNPNIRIVLNVTKGLYRVVARRSAGIEKVADLKGKRIATIAQTSSGYFLFRTLQTAGLTFDDITPVPVMPLEGMAKALESGEVDAVVIWEPYSEHSARVLGEDIVEFSDDSVYSEHFNLNSTAENLADPAKRAKIVAFVRAVIDAAAEIRRDPAAAQALVAERGGFELQDVKDAWKHHAYDADYPANLLDILVVEEQWLAGRDNRPARSREELARLIDTSVYEEALALGKGK